MRDALGQMKVGISYGVAGRTYAINSQVQAERRPVRLMRAVLIDPAIAWKVERATHRRLCHANLPMVGREWFSASVRECVNAINVEVDYFAARAAMPRVEHHLERMTFPDRRSGRKPLVFTEPELNRAEKVWLNVKAFPTEKLVAVALQAINKKFSTARARRMWGARKYSQS